MNLKIENVSDLALTIRSQDLPSSDSQLSIDTSVKFPIVLQPHSSREIQYCFHPTNEKWLDRKVAFTTANVAKYAHSIRDTATLLGRTTKAGVQSDVAPDDFELLSIAPNPARGSISVRYTLPVRSNVQAIIYDERGAEAKKLFAGQGMERGTHVTSFDLIGLPNGAYLLTLIGESSQISRKFVIDK